MVEFLDANITNKFKNKLIFLDNASSHRNIKVKEVINKDNNLSQNNKIDKKIVHKVNSRN